MRRTFPLLFLVLAACGGRDEPAAPGATPAHAYAELLDAYESGRHRDVLPCVDPEDRGLLTFILLRGASLAAAQREIPEAFEALCETHGVDPHADEKLGPLENTEEGHREMAKKLLAGTDLRTLCADLLAFLAAHSPDTVLFDAPLSEVEVTADTARAKAGGGRIDFVRRDGRWYVDVNMQ